MVRGLSIQDRMKRTSSSRRMPRLRSNWRICSSIFLPMPSRFCSKRRTWRPMLRSITLFLISRIRSCRSICCSNLRKAGSDMAMTRSNIPTFLQHFAPPGQEPEASACSEARFSGGIRACAAQAVEELLDLAEESRGFRLRVGRRQTVELDQQLALPLGELLRRLDDHLNIHVAVLSRTQHRHALAVQAESSPGLHALGNLHTRLASVDRRHFEFAAERRGHQGNRHAAVQVCAFALKKRMRGD